MISNKSSLASRLDWIIGDIEPLLEDARRSFEGYIQAADASALGQCRERCRQIWGILDILGADGASMLGREIVLLLDALLQHKVENLKAAQEAVAEGLVQLSAYLRHLREGYADLPVVVLPTLNNLRAARDAELLSEHLVFLPQEGHMNNEQIGTDQYVPVQAEKLNQVCAKLRFYFQKALLSWFRQEQPERMLPAIAKVSNNVLLLNKTERLRSLWWINAALAEALAAHKLEHSVAVKMLMGRMEREIRRFGELGENTYNLSVPDELFKNLLYYIGLAEPGVNSADGVKAAYHLDLYLPQGETLEELRQYYTTPGRDLWRAVSGSVVTELKGLQNLVEEIQTSNEQLILLDKLAVKTKNLAATLSMIGLGHAAEITQQVGEDLREKVQSNDSLDPDGLMELGTHYVRIEKVLKEYAETGYDITDSVFSDNGEINDPGTTRSLMRTTLTELNKAQTNVIAFYKEGWAFFHLEDVVNSLESIRGALDILGASELTPLVDVSQRYLREDLIAQRREPSTEELATFADILTLFEASISARLQDEDYLEFLPTGFAKLRALDKFSPLELLQQTDLESVEADVAAKKKARQLAPSTLYQRMRNQNLLATQEI